MSHALNASAAALVLAMLRGEITPAAAQDAIDPKRRRQLELPRKDAA